jgi:GWxTD domain-containing protein
MMKWNEAEEHFSWVFARDSLYRDAIYEYATFRLYREDYDEAFRLGHLQLQRKPESREGQLGLFRLYRAFLAEASPASIEERLRADATTHGKYFLGEYYRRTDRLEEAEEIFRRLLVSGYAIPVQPVYISLAMVASQRGDPVGVERFYWKAVDEIGSLLGPDLLFEHLKYIITDEEVRLFRSLTADRGKAEFFRNFWARRNPTPAARINPRLIEHFRRYRRAEQEYEYYGFRGWFDNPDQLSTLRFPTAFLLNHEFNDMGLIYLRHGEPGDIRRTMGRASMDLDQAWIYFPRPDQPQRIFNFMLKNATGNNWRLASLPGDPEMIEELAMFDNRYRELLRASPVELLQREDAVIADSRETVLEALQTDAHTWKKETRSFPIPHSIDAFRGDGGRSLVDISYALPLEPLAAELGGEARTVPVEIGLSISRPDGAEAISRLDTLQLALGPGSEGAYLSLYRYRLPADTFRIAMHAAPLGLNLIARWSNTVAIRNFRSDEPMISDIQFLLPSSQEPAIEIEGIKVVQSPFSSIPEDQPMYVYIQVYNLVKDAAGKTALRVEFVATPGQESDPENEVVLAIKDREGREESEAVFEALDLDELGTGTYTLSVRATDRNRVQTVSAHRRFEVVGR